MSEWLAADLDQAPENLTVVGYIEEYLPSGELSDVYITAVLFDETGRWVFDPTITHRFAKKKKDTGTPINTTISGIKRRIVSWTLMPFHPGHFNYFNQRGAKP